MDLGFGSSNQVVGETTARALLQSAKVQEEVLENELASYDALLQDDSALELLRRKRLEELKQRQAEQKKWKALGHGTYGNIVDGTSADNSTQGPSTDIARAFFGAAKESPRLVVHFYRTSSSRICDVFHKHLALLADRHLETRFAKINVENCDGTVSGGGAGGGSASFLVEKLGIVIMPTLVLIKDRKVIHHIRGFDELGGTDEFSTKALEYVLGNIYGVLETNGNEDIPEELGGGGARAGRKGINSLRI